MFRHLHSRGIHDLLLAWSLGHSCGFGNRLILRKWMGRWWVLRRAFVNTVFIHGSDELLGSTPETNVAIF